MNLREFWQNFKMGEEQEIACNFIYDGLRNLHEMETLSLETEIFPILYNLSIGLERLLKVTLVLAEVDEDTDIDNFEKSLITHNHVALFDRLKRKVDLDFGPTQMGLLALLSTFYSKHRYGRFNIPQRDNLSKDKRLFHSFLEKHLQIKIIDEVTGAENTFQIKKFMGKVVKKITKSLYVTISEIATTKNLYTYEISGSSSKAARIVWGGDEITFDREEVAAAEILIFFLNTKDSDRVSLLKELIPLPLDSALDSEYMDFLLGKRNGLSSAVIDEIEGAQEDLKERKERIKLIKIITDSDANLSAHEKD